MRVWKLGMDERLEGRYGYVDRGIDGRMDGRDGRMDRWMD